MLTETLGIQDDKTLVIEGLDQIKQLQKSMSSSVVQPSTATLASLGLGKYINDHNLDLACVIQAATNSDEETKGSSEGEAKQQMSKSKSCSQCDQKFKLYPIDGDVSTCLDCQYNSKRMHSLFQTWQAQMPNYYRQTISRNWSSKKTTVNPWVFYSMK